MSIELKQAAQQALEALLALHAEGARAGWHLHQKWEAQMRAASCGINALRAAIQQAESEPVGEVHSFGDTGLCDEVQLYNPLPWFTKLYTHPAPGVPDAAIDSAIYNQCPDFDDWHEGPSIDDIRAIVRAAMLAASPAQKGD